MVGTGRSRLFSKTTPRARLLLAAHKDPRGTSGGEGHTSDVHNCLTSGNRRESTKKESLLSLVNLQRHEFMIYPSTFGVGALC